MVKNRTLFSVSATAKKKASNNHLKAKNSDLYYENLYIKWYYFCQYYENHFKIIKLKAIDIYICSFFLKKKVLFLLAII